MVKAELGTKRTCPSCGARFYDLLKSPVVCPKCAHSFIAEVILPTKGEPTPAMQQRPRVAVPEEAEAAPEVEIVSLEEVEEPGDDEAAAIEDVDLGEEVAVEGAEDDVFLEEEEEDKSVPDIIGGPNDKEPEET